MAIQTTSTPAQPPADFICPVTRKVMIRPLMSRWGHNFERSAILSWVTTAGCCPVTGKPMSPSDLVPNRTLEHRIKFWRMENNIAAPTEDELAEEKCHNVVNISFNKQAEILSRPLSLTDVARVNLTQSAKPAAQKTNRKRRATFLARILNKAVKDIEL